MLRQAIILSLFLTGPALAQDKDAKEQKEAPDKEKKGEEDGTLKQVGKIATQPARDVGIDKVKIPPILEKSTAAPYAPPRANSCKAINGEIAELTVAIGADFGTGTENNENRAGKMMEAGGSALVNSLIPFRGLVREVSGAAPAERRLNAAISTGLARRGYLRGLGKARKCKAPG